MRPSAVLAVAVALVVAAAYASDLLLLDYFGPFIVLTYALGTFTVVGLILALRRPRHPIGWLFLAGGLGSALASTARAYAWYALAHAPGTLPAGELAAWLSTVAAPPQATCFFIAAYLFPTGRSPTRRWAAFVPLGIAVAVAQTLAWGFAPRPLRIYALSRGPGPLDVVPTIPNPAGIGGPVGDVLATLKPAIDAAIAPLILLSLVAIVLRYRRSTGIERLQMKWFFYVASLWIGFVTVAGTFPRPLSDFAWVISEVLRAFVPVAVGIAILRYRLYEIDVLINRTLVYGSVSAALLATYLGAVILFQTSLRAFTSGSELAVAASTLLVVALFHPLRRRVQEVVDRRFYRSRYDAARTLDAFGLRLREEVDLDSVRTDLLDVVGRTVRPAHASLWLREQ